MCWRAVANTIAKLRPTRPRPFTLMLPYGLLLCLPRCNNMLASFGLGMLNAMEPVHLAARALHNRNTKALHSKDCM